MRRRSMLMCFTVLALLLSTACGLSRLGLGPTEAPEPTSTVPATATPEPTATSAPAATSTYTPEPTNTPPAPTSTLISGPALPNPQLPPVATAAPVAAPTQQAAPTHQAAPTSQPPAPQPTARPAGGASAQTVKAQIQTTRQQMEEFGGMIDIAIGQGYVDCAEVVNRYDTLAASPEMSVTGSDPAVSRAYDLYRQGVGVFTSGARDMAQNCRDFIAAGGGGSIPFQQWGLARQRVNEAVALLNQALAGLP